MPRVVFLQVDCGGRAEHVVTDVAGDGTGWDDGTTPTVVLYGSGGSTEIVAEQNATVVAPTELEAAEATKSQSISVSDSTGLRRWDQIVIGPSSRNGRWEWGIIDGIVTGLNSDTLYLLAPLQHDYAKGDAVGARTLAVEFTAEQITAVRRHCRLEWKYIQAGLARRESTVVHLSRYCPRYALSDAELEAVVPTALRKIGPHQRLTLIIRQVWERKVLPSIARLMPPGGLVSGEAADELLLAAVAHQVCEAARDNDQADRWAEAYDGLLGGLQDSITDLDESGYQSSIEKPRSRRSVRALRG